VPALFSASLSASPVFESLSSDGGVAALEGSAVSSASSMTKAASKTAGSGLAAPSPFASFVVRSSLAFFVGRGLRAGDCVPAPLEDRDRREAELAEPGACFCASMLALCLACSSAMDRSIALLNLCHGRSKLGVCISRMGCLTA
jgi:hypothetical protein